MHCLTTVSWTFMWISLYVDLYADHSAWWSFFIYLYYSVRRSLYADHSLWWHLFMWISLYTDLYLYILLCKVISLCRSHYMLISIYAALDVYFLVSADFLYFYLCLLNCLHADFSVWRWVCILIFLSMWPFLHEHTEARHSQNRPFSFEV